MEEELLLKAYRYLKMLRDEHGWMISFTLYGDGSGHIKYSSEIAEFGWKKHFHDLEEACLKLFMLTLIEDELS